MPRYSKYLVKNPETNSYDWLDHPEHLSPQTIITERRSDSLGCNPAFAEDVERQAAALGAPDMHIDRETGQAVFRGIDSRAQRRRYARALGMHDNDGGYGDP